jgi:hypothetical protein
MLNTWKYQVSPSRIATNWLDKQHQLLYDLCKEIEHLQCRKAREERWAGQVEATCIARSLMP